MFEKEVLYCVFIPALEFRSSDPVCHNTVNSQTYINTVAHRYTDIGYTYNDNP